ncbi:BTAD domain-containing putative transcriptional regulator [Micromonospora sp. NBC_00617]|uniref:BTAD domain-containing putative transcriptional regulator n=1 Tax=Micromonospora sp. NBC_00617 TaxID=2903587 RepID=UPI0030E2C450
MPLGGTKQRAALGYLLLRPNRVVATSQLLYALWPADDAPVSARKILQNAVWGLRRVLAAADGADQVELMTQSPGYKLVVAPDSVDLVQFQAQADTGRERLARGEPAAAAAMLRQALDLWRGPALADLTEADIVWPELTAVENSRLDALEDYFEAQLACGQHQSVLADLETMVCGSNLRERSCQQLMLALYRSGRQADALNVYRRMRTYLVEELGLEPGRDLQVLHNAILAQDPALDVDTTTTGEPAVVVSPAADPVPARIPAQRAPLVAPPADPVAAAASARRQVSVLLVSTQVDDESRSSGHPDADALLAGVADDTRRRVEHLGGQATAAIGPISMAVFPADGGQDGAQRAVFAALAVRERLCDSGDEVARPPVRFRAAVVTGSALVRYESPDGGALSSATGQVLDRCHALLARAGDGEIRICDETRCDVDDVYRSDRLAEPGEWTVRGLRFDEAAYDGIPLVEREFELLLIRDLLERARYRNTPHLVTILGESGTGKTRFLAELRHVISGLAHVARFPVAAGGAAEQAVSGAFAVQRELILALCEVDEDDSVDVRKTKLDRTLRNLVRDPDRQRTLAACLRAYVDPDADRDHLGDLQAELGAWRQFLEHVPLDRPLVLLIDDLHDADDDVLTMVNGLADVSDVPLLVVASAQPCLLEVRPGWGGGKRHITTLTLDALSDTAVDRLLDSADGQAARGLGGWLRQLLGASAGTHPDERRRHLRSLLAMRPPRYLTATTTSCVAG